MNVNPEQAGILLKAGISLLRGGYLMQGIDKSLRAIEDELGYAIGKEGHTIRKWKSGEIPLANGFRTDFLHCAEILTKEMIALGKRYPDHQWGKQFLKSVGHPNPNMLCTNLAEEAQATSQDMQRPIRVKKKMGLSERVVDDQAVNAADERMRVEIVLQLNRSNHSSYQQFFRFLARYRRRAMPTRLQITT